LKTAVLVELETKVAFQDDTIQKLNEVVCRQQEQIDLLLVKYQELRGLLEDLPDNQPLMTEANETPPHY
jgi:SlyX protein|tara:strand:- start:1461 stop:1667 length:207 start_codon:yes stop_codon:yes gene_type:complete